jgi:prophage regulatory protein
VARDKAGLPPILNSAPSSIKGQIMSAVLSRNAMLPETGFLRQPQVLTFIPISKSTLWRRVWAGTFPAPLKLSARVTVWRVEDVRCWIQEQGCADATGPTS